MFARSIAFLVSFSFPLLAWSSADSNELILKSLMSKLSSIKTLQADLEVSSTVPPMKVRGTLYAITPQLLRMDLTTTSASNHPNEPTQMKSQLFLNGKKSWLSVVDPSQGPLFLGKFDLNQVKASVPKRFTETGFEELSNPAFQLLDLRRPVKTPINTFQLDSKQTYVIEGVPKRSSSTLFNLNKELPSSPNKIKLWVGQDDGITYQFIEFDAHGKILHRGRLVNVRINPSLEPSLFDFHPTSKTDVVDLTDSIKSELTGKGHP